MNDDIFKRLAEDVAREVPELRGVMDQVKAGSLSESEGLQQMVAVCLKNPKTAQALMVTSQKALATPRPENLPTVRQEDLVFHSGVGLPQLHPLMQAAIIERLQFDGDIPEMRTGPLDSEASPAVSVDTLARNPAALGQMLRQASADMAGKVGAFRQNLLAQHDQSGALMRLDPEQRLALLEEIQGADHPEYLRGQVPAPVAMTVPDGETLALMPLDERQQNTWQFLSTTQGRRSALQSIEKTITVALGKAGHKVTLLTGRASLDLTLVAEPFWSISIDGPRSMQPEFSPIDTAALALYRGILDAVQGSDTEVILEVTEAMFRVGWPGWRARAYVSGLKKPQLTEY